MTLEEAPHYFCSDIGLYSLAFPSPKKEGNDDWKIAILPNQAPYHLRTLISPVHAHLEKMAFNQKGYPYRAVPTNILKLESFIQEQGDRLNFAVGYGFAAVGDRLLADPETGVPMTLMVYKSFPMNGIPLESTFFQFGDEFQGVLENIWKHAGVPDYGRSIEKWAQEDSHSLKKAAKKVLRSIRNSVDADEETVASHYALYDPVTHQWRFADLDLLRQHGTA
ncbi:hypothetical protein [Alloalcanivorax balearicus]|uniref:hypothetical protein n=1 Tax=Alloalcanivorax balearicus TaxID=413232 RepID=UPI0021CD1F15|nr:hypothetical protein [Alloalcanivorax balearicus]